MIDNILKRLVKKNKIKITFPKDKRDYRYDIHCPDCGKFKGKGHKCKSPPRKEYGWYRCSICGRYYPYHFFQKDRTKRFGINTRCKQCRKETGNGNKIVEEGEKNDEKTN